MNKAPLSYSGCRHHMLVRIINHNSRRLDKRKTFSSLRHKEKCGLLYEKHKYNEYLVGMGLSFFELRFFLPTASAPLEFTLVSGLLLSHDTSYYSPECERPQLSPNYGWASTQTIYLVEPDSLSKCPKYKIRNMPRLPLASGQRLGH